MSKTVYIIIALIIGLIGGYFVGQNSGVNAAYQKGIKKGKQIVEEKVEKFFPTEENITEMSGEIKGVSSNSIKVKFTFGERNPLVEDSTQIKTVKVDEETKLIKHEEKTEEEFEKEQKEYQEKLEKNPEAKVEHPSPFKETSISVSDLKSGDIVMVSSGKNIKETDSFKASKIIKEIR